MDAMLIFTPVRLDGWSWDGENGGSCLMSEDEIPVGIVYYSDCYGQASERKKKLWKENSHTKTVHSEGGRK